MPTQDCPEQQSEVLRELAQDTDTLASLASRHGLPVRSLLQWRGPRGPEADRPGLLLGGLPPCQARLTGPT
jgi:hypothetical protein